MLDDLTLYYNKLMEVLSEENMTYEDVSEGIELYGIVIDEISDIEQELRNSILPSLLIQKRTLRDRMIKNVVEENCEHNENKEDDLPF